MQVLISIHRFCRYIHNKDWENAERVAETYDDSAMIEVLVEQAKEEFQSKNYTRFESLLLRAHKPEMIISLYKVRYVYGFLDSEKYAPCKRCFNFCFQ